MLFDMVLLPEVLAIGCSSQDEYSAVLQSFLREFEDSLGVMLNLEAGLWQKKIHQHVRRMPRGIRNDVQKILSTLFDQKRIPFVCASSAQTTVSRWDKTHRELVDSYNADFLVTGESPIEVSSDADHRIRKFGELRVSDEWKRVRRPKHSCKRNLGSYRTGLQKALKYARKVTYIDAILRPDTNNGGRSRRHKSVVDWCFEDVGAGLHAPGIKRIRFDICDGYCRELDGNDSGNPSAWHRVLSQLSRSRLAGSRRVSVLCWDYNYSEHDRFLLTDVLNLNLSSGLDPQTGRKEKQMATWTKFDEDEAEPVRKIFNEFANPKQLLWRMDLLPQEEPLLTYSKD